MSGSPDGSALRRAAARAALLVADVGDAWLDPAQVSTVEGTRLERLAALRQVAAAVEEATAQAVQHARDAGESWAAIGEALGVSRQAAHERWGRRTAERRLV